MVAEGMGVRDLGTMGVVLEAFICQHIEYDGLQDVVRDLAGVLWLREILVPLRAPGAVHRVRSP